MNGFFAKKGYGLTSSWTVPITGTDTSFTFTPYAARTDRIGINYFNGGGKVVESSTTSQSLSQSKSLSVSASQSASASASTSASLQHQPVPRLQRQPVRQLQQVPVLQSQHQQVLQPQHLQVPRFSKHICI